MVAPSGTPNRIDTTITVNFPGSCAPIRSYSCSDGHDVGVVVRVEIGVSNLSHLNDTGGVKKVFFLKRAAGHIQVLFKTFLNVGHILLGRKLLGKGMGGTVAGGSHPSLVVLVSQHADVTVLVTRGVAPAGIDGRLVAPRPIPGDVTAAEGIGCHIVVGAHIAARSLFNVGYDVVIHRKVIDGLLP